MFKAIGIIFIVLAGFFCGMFEAQKLKNRAEFFDCLVNFITYLKTQIRYSCDEIINIISGYDFPNQLKYFRNIDTTGYENRNFADIFCSRIKAIPKSLGLKKEDYSALSKFAKGLGITDVTGQIDHCNLYCENFSKKRDEALNEKNKKYKLYILLGTFLGICIAIVLA